MAIPKLAVRVGRRRGVITKGIFVLTIISLLILYSSRFGTTYYSTYIMYASHPSLLFDGEVTDETIDRRELTFTDFGWNHPNLTISRGYGRDKATGSFADAVVAHPRYNASAWTRLSQNPDPHRPIVAFVDIQTCGETCWPNMNHCGALEENSDLRNDRTALTDYTDGDVCGKIEQALSSPAMIAPGSRLVALHCQPGDHGGWGVVCGGGSRDGAVFDKLVVPAQTKYKTEGIASQDMGLSPLPVKPVALNASEIDDISSCRLDSSTRPYLFFFNGRPRVSFPQFGDYFGPLHGSHGIYARFGSDHYVVANVTEVPPEKQRGDRYMNLLRSALFAGSPRGDNLYSYRFSEILSAGAIPVVYADGWILPYTSSVVNWNDVAVLIPQGEVNRTLDILMSYDDDRICEMQRAVLKFYKEYVKDSSGRLRGILKVLEGRLTREVNYSFAPGDTPPYDVDW